MSNKIWDMQKHALSRVSSEGRLLFKLSYFDRFRIIEKNIENIVRIKVRLR